MLMKRVKFILLTLLSLSALVARADRLNDKIQNRPYADLRPWHLGFSVGLHTQDLTFAHNGFVTEAGETGFMEQPSVSPGCCVTGHVFR